MASKLDYTQISEIVSSLDVEFQKLREDARGRYDLYAMKRDPHVPDEIAREGKERYLSALLINAAQSIRADIMMNPTEFTVFPLAREQDGSISRKSEGLAENLERSLAVIWGRMNEGRRVDREVVWHQLISPFAVMMLEFQDLDLPDQPDWMEDGPYAELITTLQREYLPWHIYTPDPMTCAWIEHDGKPVLFTRKYKMLVRDVERMYSRNQGAVEPDKLLRLSGDHFKWVSDDYPADLSQYKAGFREVEMLWLDDGDNIYHVACNLEGKSGEVVYSCPNPTGRVTAFVIPGNTTPSRKVEDKYEPFMLPLMQSVMQINNIRSTRATAARNLAGPHTYVPIDPELAKLYISKGEKLPTDIKWKKNVTPYLLGQVKEVPSELSPDWDRLEQAINEDLQRFLPSPFVHVVDPAVLKAATATSILHAAESGMRLYGPLMATFDAAVRDMTESMVDSIRNGFVDQEVLGYATGDEMARGRNLTQGQIYKLDAGAVSFPHKIIVKTRGMSQAQAAAQFDLILRQWVLPDGSKGPATMDDVIAAANYTDSRAQKMKLAKESMLNHLDPLIQQHAYQAAAKQIFLDSGIQLPMDPTMGGGVPGADGMGAPENGDHERAPSGLTNAAQRMDAPLVTGVEGGSDGGEY